MLSISTNSNTFNPQRTPYGLHPHSVQEEEEEEEEEKEDVGRGRAGPCRAMV